MNTATIVHNLVTDRLSHPQRSYASDSLMRAVKNAKRDAAIRAEWYSLEDAGFVRMEFPVDDHADIYEMKGDCYSESNADSVPGGMRTIKAQEKAFERMVEREGVCGMVGEYRLDPDGDEWEHGDSIWGFVGHDDAENSGYMPDVMEATIQALKDARASACPHCGRAAKH